MMAFSSGAYFPKSEEEGIKGMRMTWIALWTGSFHYMTDMQPDAGANYFFVALPLKGV